MAYIFRNPCFINDLCEIKHEFLEIRYVLDMIKENMLCNNYTITAKHLQFLFAVIISFNKNICTYIEK